MLHYRTGMALCALGALLSSCTTLPRGDSDYQPTSRWERVRHAAVNAATRTSTWAPAAGALVMSVGDIDERVSSWATEHTFVFGSQEDASQASNDLRALACAGTMLTSLAVLPGVAPSSKTSTVTKSFATSGTALVLNSAMIGFLKETAGRERPNGENTESLPSSHSAQAAGCATLASRNLDSVSMSDEMRMAMRISFSTLAAGTAWARIEGNHHYPSDTLAGAAIANFLSHFVYDAFIGSHASSPGDGGPGTDLTVDIIDNGWWIRMQWDF